MHPINWTCCPLAAQNPITRAFIEQLARERKAPSTVENYGRDLNDFLAAFSAMPFVAVLEADESQIAQYIDGLWERDARRGSGHRADRSTITYLTGSKLAPATIRRRLSTIRLFFRWCIRLRYRQDATNPVREGVRGQTRGLVAIPTSVPWIPDDQQWANILTYVLTSLSLRNQALVLVAYDGALRRAEVTSLRVGDIDWKSGTIAIRREVTKNKMPGLVVLSHTTYRILKRYVTCDRAHLVAAYGADPAGPIFLSEAVKNPGQPITKWTVKDVFDQIRDALNIPQLTPHKVRHLMLTDLKKSGMDLLDVSRYGRHKSIASTQIYVHTDVSDLARQVNKAHARRQQQLAHLFAAGHTDGER